MALFYKFQFRPRFMVPVLSALLICSCATTAPPDSDSTGTNTQLDASANSSAETGTMREICAEMHEQMKAKMSKDGMMSGDGKMAMSPEMKEKHKKCMEMKETMHDHCRDMNKGANNDEMMTKGGMHERCKTMANEPTTGAGAGEEK